MSLTEDKYIRISLDLEKSAYHDLKTFVDDRGCTLAHFLRRAIETQIDHVRYQEARGKSWVKSNAS